MGDDKTLVRSGREQTRETDGGRNSGKLQACVNNNSKKQYNNKNEGAENRSFC